MGSTSGAVPQKGDEVVVDDDDDDEGGEGEKRCPRISQFSPPNLIVSRSAS